MTQKYVKSLLAHVSNTICGESNADWKAIIVLKMRRDVLTMCLASLILLSSNSMLPIQSKQRIKLCNGLINLTNQIMRLTYDIQDT